MKKGNKYSVQDYLASKGEDGSYKARKAKYDSLFEGKYTGTAEQNMRLLQMLKSGNAQNTAPAPQAQPKQEQKPAAKKYTPPAVQKTTDGSKSMLAAPKGQPQLFGTNIQMANPKTAKDAPAKYTPKSVGVTDANNAVFKGGVSKKPSAAAIIAKNLDGTDGPGLIEQAGDYLEMGMNYIQRKYKQTFGEDESTVSKITTPAPQPKPTVKDSTPVKATPPPPPAVITGDTLWDSKRAYHLPEIVDISRVKFGARNRGDRTETETDGLAFTNFDNNRIVSSKSIKLDNNQTYIGIDPEGNMKVGTGDMFADKEYQLSPFASHMVKGFSKGNDGKYKTSDASNSWRGSVMPNMVQTDGSEVPANFLMMSKDPNASKTFGDITGGRAIFTSPDFSKQVLLSGSVETIDQQLEKWKADNKLDSVRYVRLDNGSYSRAYRTKDGVMTADDWRSHDNRNSWGGHGFYYKKGQGSMPKYYTGGPGPNNINPQALLQWAAVGNNNFMSSGAQAQQIRGINLGLPTWDGSIQQTDLPYGVTDNMPNAAKGSLQDSIDKGIIAAPEGYGSAQEAYNHFNTPAPTEEKIGILDPRRNNLHPGVVGANYAMQGITAVGNIINNNRAKQETAKSYLEQYQPKYWENMERYGLNANPMYTKYGGAIAKYFFGGGGGNPVKPAPSAADVAYAEAHAKNFAARHQLGTVVRPEDVHTGGQIPKVTLDGKPIAFGTPMLQPTPKYNKVPTGVNSFEYMNGVPHYQDPQSGDFMPFDPVYINLPQFKQKTFATGGMANNVIEAEGGEVFQDLQGNINQISEDAPMHEDGGVIVPNVQRVLEHTSMMRKDPNSKALKLDPNKVKALTGIDTKQSMSHAKAAQVANERYEGARFKFVKQIEKAAKGKKHLDKYAENSINLNLETMKTIPDQQKVFDSLFAHQEMVKAMHGIQTGQKAQFGGKFALGGYNTPPEIVPYGNAKTKAGGIMPSGKSNKYNRGKDYLASWEKHIPGISKLDNKSAQSKIYDWMLNSDEGMGRLSQMWRESGLTNEGKKHKDLVGMVDKNFNFDPNKELSPEQLQSLKRAYVDGFFGARQADPFETPVEVDEDPIDIEIPPQRLDTSVNTDITKVNNPKSEFYEPLRWYDLASSIGAYTSALERVPPKYNPAEMHQLRYKLQDPTAALNQNQADFNAASQVIADTPAGAGTQMANVANLAAQKYAANNQLLGQYENQNVQTKNSEITYNTQVRDKQSILDQQARNVYEVNDLDSMAKQQEQKLTALDSLYKTIAQNKALNRNGNLVMKFANAFDQYGDYNGFQHLFATNPAAGIQAITQMANTKSEQGRLQELKEGSMYYQPKEGKTYRFMGGKLTSLG
jgi:hypothetical protein